MRRLALAATALCASASPALAQTFLTNFHKLFDHFSTSDMEAAIQTDDKGYAYTGTHPNIILPTSWGRVLLHKLTPTFDHDWAMTYVHPGEPATGPSPEMRAYDVQQTADGGYVLCGDYLVEGAGTGWMSYLLKTDDLGQVMWFQLYPTIDHLYSVAEVEVAGKGKGFFAVGQSDDVHSAVALRTDPYGAVQCVKHVWADKNGVQSDGIYAQVIPYSKELFAMVGSVAWGYDDSDVLLTIMDADCNVLVNRVYGETITYYPGNPAPYGVFETAWSLVELDGGHLALTGNYTTRCLTACVPNPIDDVLVMRVDGKGNPVWSNRYDLDEASDWGLHLTYASTSKGKKTRIYVTGRADTTVFDPDRSQDAFLLELGPKIGAVDSCEVYGDDGAEAGEHVLPNLDGHLCILANTGSFGFGHDVTYWIERYANKIEPCHDRMLDPPSYKLFPEEVKPYEVKTLEPWTKEVLEARPMFLDDPILCEKIQIQ
ncbi:MAG: hypothetical protein AAF682_25460 [Planctomycetota bacterium]